MGLRQMSTAHRDEGGAIAVMAAVLAMALLASTALAVDVGRTAYVSRDQQGATDRAALDGVRLLHQAILDGETAQTLVDQVYATATESMETRNPPPGGTERRSIYRVDLGRVGVDGFVEECREYYLAEGDEAPEDEDTASHSPCEGNVADLEVDAVRLWTHGEVGYVLPLGGQRSAELRKMAVATSDAIGSISAASTTAILESGVINELLSAMVGSDDEVLDLGLVGYEGVADATIDLWDLVQSDEITVGSVDELLTTELSVLDILNATASALEAGEDEEAASAADLQVAAALRDLATAGASAGLTSVTLGYDPDDQDSGILHVSTGDGAGADLQISALDLATSALQLANRNRAVTLDTGVFEMTPLELKVIQPPVTAIGPAGQINGEWRTTAPTAQVELALDLSSGPASGGIDGGGIDERVGRYEDMLDPVRENSSSDCSARADILEEIDNEVEQIKDYFADTGLLTSVVTDLIDGLVGAIDGLLECSWLAGLGEYEPTAEDVEDAIADYRGILEAMGDEALALLTGEPDLAVTVGGGEVRLAEISCTNPGATRLNARTSAAEITGPETTILDLAPLAYVSLGIDADVATQDGHEQWVDAPYPSEPVRFASGGQIGLAELVDGLGPRVTLLDERLDSDHLMTHALQAVAPVLEEVDDDVAALFELLGLDLGVVEGRVLSVQCTGRRLAE